MATKSEINRRFRLLLASMLTAACCEVVIEFLTDMKTVTVWRKIFYATVNVNSYCLMCYVAAYTRKISRRFVDINFFILVVSIIIPFVLHSSGDMGHLPMFVWHRSFSADIEELPKRVEFLKYLSGDEDYICRESHFKAAILSAR